MQNTPSEKLRKPDILSHIRQVYDSLSKGQQKVAEFLLTQGLEAVYLSATRIAQQVGVSDATVIRTAQALGYEGFPDLQTALQAHISKRISVTQRVQLGSRQLIEDLGEQRVREGIGPLLLRMVQAEADTLHKLAQQAPIADLEQAVNLLDTARRVYLLGLRIDLPLVTHLGVLLSYVRQGCIVLDPGDTIVEQLEELGPEDVLLVISTGRHEVVTLRALEFTQRIGAQSIAFTESLLSPVAKRANLVFIVPPRLWAIGHSLATFALLNALFGALFVRHSEVAQERLRHLDTMYEHFQTFATESDDDSPGK